MLRRNIMKIIIKENRIIATANDEYQGPEEFISVPDDEFDIAKIDQYQITDGHIAPKIPESVSMRQARLVLLQQGILDDVEVAINSINDESTRKAVQIEWEYALDIRRDWPALLMITQSMGITDEQLDQMFVVAGTL